MVYAVIDTNIFVSALITHNSNASTARVLESLLLHRIIPLYNDDIIKEYDEVLHRAKFKLSEEQISTVIEHVKENGIDSSRFPYDGEMPDEDDRVFFHHSHLYSKAVPSRTTMARALKLNRSPPFPRRSHPAQPWRRALMPRQPYSAAVPSTGGRLHPRFLRKRGLGRKWSSLWLKGDGGFQKCIRSNHPITY